MLSAELESRASDLFCVRAQSRIIKSQNLCGVTALELLISLVRYDDVDAAVETLKSRGLGFDTNVTRGPGLIQVFSSRSIETELRFEIIHRDGESAQTSLLVPNSIIRAESFFQII